jgi:uncharacterized Zn finger protein (UPF0148 family)
MSGQSENLVTSCPQCNSLVGLPSVMSLDARVRCPVCGHKYTLRSRLPQTIPQLELIVQSDDSDEETSSSVEIDATAKLQVNDILRKNARLSRRRNRRRSSSEGGRRPQVEASATGAPSIGQESTSFKDFQAAALGTLVDDQPTAGESTEWQANERAGLRTAGDLAAYERKAAFRTKPKHRPSRKSQQWIEIAKIACGALLALPVAQLIIWWGLSVDPLKLAPTVAKAVPFVVPVKVLEAAEEE